MPHAPARPLLRALRSLLPPPRRSARRGLPLVLLLALLPGPGCGGGGAPPPTPAPDVLLPDGRTRGSVDFLLDAETLSGSLWLVDRTFAPGDCAVVEGTVEAAGTRRLLSFDTRIVNLGELDLHIGDPAAPRPPLDAGDFEYHDCHGHRHLHGYAAYELRRPDGSPAARGVKQGFCLLDSEAVHPSAGPRRFDCADQGLSSGWADLYGRTLDGQWIDVTGVPAGDYVLVVTINAEGTLPEAVDHHPNTAQVLVTLPDPSAPVAAVDDHGGSAAQATLLAFPSGVVAAVEAPLDADWFRLPVTAGRVYTLRTELLTLPDSVLRLTTVTGSSTLAASDDVVPGSDRSSRIVWTAAFTGEVALEVTGAGTATGTYRLVVE